jgi:hypothetical protein
MKYWQERGCRIDIRTRYRTQLGRSGYKNEADTVQDIDFGHFLSQLQHPDIRTYLEAACFNAYLLEHGELLWGDYDLCFSIILETSVDVPVGANLFA